MLAAEGRYDALVTVLAVVGRIAQLGGSILLVGALAFPLLVASPAFERAGPPLRPALDALDRRLLQLAAAALAVTFAASFLSLWVQAAAATGRSLADGLAPEVLGGVLVGTRYGHVWLARLGLAALVAGVLAAVRLHGERNAARRARQPDPRERESGCLPTPAAVAGDRRGWTWRVAGLVLAAAMLAAGAWAGHAGAAEGRALVFQMTADVLHLLAAGAWLGGLPCLALLLDWARRAAGRVAPGPVPAATAAAVAAEATRRFSLLALVAVGLLVQSGLATAWALVGSVPALIGTRYGRLLLLKVALLLPLLGVAAANLLREKPRLVRAAAAGGPGARGAAEGSAPGEGAGEAPDPARRAATPPGVAAGAAATVAHGGRGAAAAVLGRLRRNVLVEVALGAAVLAVVGWLGITAPARHDEPVWPLSFRVSTDAMQAVLRLPGVGPRAATGVNIVFWSLLAFGYAALVPRHRAAAAAAGAAGLVLGGWVLWPIKPLVVVDAYPTTYVRPAVPYHALSVASGLRLYRAHCAVCHGETGYGDGPAAAGLSPRPANLTAGHTRDHTAGDLFWWITHGIKGSAMPGFGDRLAEEERWDLVNAVRALADSDAAGALRPAPDPAPRIVAPDLAYTTADGRAGALKDFRGRAVVLLVLFNLPDSGRRLADLNEAYARLRRAGGELLAVPLDTGSAATAAALRTPLAFPVVADGAPEAAATYLLFRRGPALPRHVELLVDRQGYFRARWMPGERNGWDDVDRLVGLVERLAKEPPRAAPAAEHVH